MQLMRKLKKKPRIPPEEYAKQKTTKKRQNLYDMAEKQTHEVVSSPQNYLNYLEMQSKILVILLPIHSWSWHNVHKQHC